MTEDKEEIKPLSHGEFRGDFARNEVQLDLDRFMQVLQENSSLKDQIRDLRDEKDSNPWQKWIHFAKMVDQWRIWSRAFITVYMCLLYYTTIWFMDLEAPTLEQSGLISVVVGAGAAWFGLYIKGGPEGSD